MERPNTKFPLRPGLRQVSAEYRARNVLLEHNDVRVGHDQAQLAQVGSFVKRFGGRGDGAGCAGAWGWVEGEKGEEGEQEEGGQGEMHCWLGRLVGLKEMDGDAVAVAASSRSTNPTTPG